jgi:flagellar hook-associated protein 3 FlgL
MRVSTNMFHTTGFNSISQHQNEILKIQEQLSTGNKVNRPSDDPVGTTQIHALTRTMNTIDQYSKNGEYASSQLVLEETAIKDTQDVLQRVRDIGIMMSNDTYNPDQRRIASIEIGQLMQHVKGIMNMKNSDGEYLFAANNVHDEPYIEDPNNAGYMLYIGNPNAAADYKPEANYGGRFVQIGFDPNNKLDPDDPLNTSRVRITDAGPYVFDINATALGPQSDPPAAGEIEGNIYNAMEMLRRQLAGLEPADSPNGRPTSAVLEDITTGIETLSESVAKIGVRQVRIESQYDAGETFKLSLTERRMNIQETDVVKGITDFTMRQNALQMAQQVFTKVQGMSLFNYLN